MSTFICMGKTGLILCRGAKGTKEKQPILMCRRKKKKHPRERDNRDDQSSVTSVQPTSTEPCNKLHRPNHFLITTVKEKLMADSSSQFLQVIQHRCKDTQDETLWAQARQSFLYTHRVMKSRDWIWLITIHRPRYSKQRTLNNGLMTLDHWIEKHSRKKNPKISIMWTSNFQLITTLPLKYKIALKQREQCCNSFPTLNITYCWGSSQT